MCRGLWKNMTKWPVEEIMEWMWKKIGNNVSVINNNNNNNNLVKMLMGIEIDKFGSDSFENGKRVENRFNHSRKKPQIVFE